MFAEIILPVPLSDTYTYSVPPEMESLVSLGSLVRVEFGKSGKYWGVVYGIKSDSPVAADTIKPIIAIDTAFQPVSKLQLRFWRWLSDYYMCSLGETLKAALPFSLSTEKPPFEKKRRTIRKETDCPVDAQIKQLSPLQTATFNDINAIFKTKDICLLYGVTSSGKTEIYIHLIINCLKQNKQALYLLPEIALTTQLTDRLRSVFGDNMYVYHSRISDGEREAIWKTVRENDKPCLVLGVRSSLFLPFSALGLVIVDEEHETSYKQQDPAPRYHARNAALALAKMSGAKTLLGSATPSIESFYYAQTGKYGYVRLDKRFEDVQLPIVTPVDVRELRRKKQMKSLFSPLLTEKMRKTLDEGGQILLFHNRRGFSTSIVCKICDWTPKCRYCDVSLTYHKQSNRLVCHYCGRKYQIPKKCPDCGSENLQNHGYGAEKVEEEVGKLFPEATVERLDSDTAKNKKTTEEIIARFESGETQILTGTQMTAKGLDFSNLSLVAILNADSLMNFPDFRAYERAFQLISQVAGRAGRRKTRGEAILQTASPDHPLILMALAHNYEGMYEMQTEERRLFRYPPFSRIIYIDLKHSKENIAEEAARNFAETLQNSLGNRVIGPDKPPIGKLKNLFVRRIMLKVEPEIPFSQLRTLLKQTQTNLLAQSQFRYVSLRYDIDPV